jgi:Amt family ammonium transporter
MSGGTDMIVTYDGTTAAYSPGDISWVLTCTALVFLMIPGLGYLYSGLARRKNALHMLLMTFMALTVVSIQWVCFGYSITFSSTGGAFIGNLRNGGFIDVLELPVSAANNKIPEIVYAMYEVMFANLVPAIAIGAACERARVFPFIIFTLVWTTFVYDFIAHWIWSSTGWAYTWGVLDYAGGGPVEVCSGVTGVVISYYLGKRHGYGTDRLLFKPHNVSHIVLGTALLWFGWLGFNGGSTFAANLRAGMAIATTNTAASVAGLTWMIMDYRFERKWSVVGFCTGAIAGLVAITPAAGFIGVPASMLVGFLAALISNLCTKVKTYAHCDDVMDVFAVHAVAGVVGLLLTGIFAQSSVAANDGYLQISQQLAWSVAVTAWTGGVTYAIMFVLDHIPGIGPFRATETAEIIGVDEEQCGEFAYDFAYFNRDLEGNYDPEHGQKLSMMEHRDGKGGVVNHAANSREGAGGQASPNETATEVDESQKAEEKEEEVAEKHHTDVDQAANSREASNGQA